MESLGNKTLSELKLASNNLEKQQVQLYAEKDRLNNEIHEANKMMQGVDKNAPNYRSEIDFQRNRINQAKLQLNDNQYDNKIGEVKAQLKQSKKAMKSEFNDLEAF